MSELQFLYRFWDGEELLYVGISVNAYQRAARHAISSPFFHHTDRITLERFSSREEVEEAERRAISTESPKYNIVYSGRSPEEIASRRAERVEARRQAALRGIATIDTLIEEEKRLIERMHDLDDLREVRKATVSASIDARNRRLFQEALAEGFTDV